MNTFCNADRPSLASSFQSILDISAIQAWETLEPTLQSRISQAIAPPNPIDLVYPNTQDELAAVITCAHQNHWRILPCGNASKLHWGGLAEGIQLVVSTARLNRLLDHAVGDLTVTAEAGMRLVDLQAILAQQGQFLAIDPAYPESATLGGIVATADTGSWRQRYGGIRDLLIGISFVRSDGKVARAGGRVVKNVAGYDLMKLFIGSYGTLGIISQVTFRLYPLPPNSQTLLLTGETQAIAKVSTALRMSVLTPTAIDLLPPQTITALSVGEGMGLLIRVQGIPVSVETQLDHLLQIGQNAGLKSDRFTETDEATLWQRLRERMISSLHSPTITCKIGIVPSTAAETLAQIATLTAIEGCIHALSGIGTLRFDSATSIQTLLTIRKICQSQGGFLTVLEASPVLKKQLDVWGDVNNSLDVMKKIKQQFDPGNLLSPCRFVGGI
ncbi:MAG: FAD-binding oxidoreductase [Cyanobacteria bacterium CRU_2_1]|nr:FAD-binding oxidoreductase [Cyanobacteria bacterium CRU_2_1]